MGPVTPESQSALEQLPLSCAAARRAGLGELRHAASTGSTNDDLAREARLGDRSSAVLVADHQTAGKGRLGRRWSDAATGSHGGEASLLVSFRLAVAAVRAPDLAAAVSVAAVRAPDLAAAVSAAALASASSALRDGEAVVRTKWPNDLVIESPDLSGKLAGVLSEMIDGDPVVVVVGLGLNIAEAPREPGAVSLVEAGGVASRDQLLASLMDGLPGYLSDPRRAQADLRAASATLGAAVRVQRTDGTSVVGTAVDIDGTGRLIVDGDHGEVAIDAGDVFHLRA